MGPKGKKEPDNLRVFLRVRPAMGREIAEKHSMTNISYDDADKRVIKVRRRMDDIKPFMFHEVFQPNSSQQSVYDSFAHDAVQQALQGYHGVLFVYGQTGSGKTFTMSNDEVGKEGMLQRACRALWDHIDRDVDFDYDVTVSYVQLYNELLTDMLEERTDESQVRLSGVADRKNDVSMVNEKSGRKIERGVVNYEETLQLFHSGAARRKQSSTNMNDQSSRSHTVFSITIKKNAKGDGKMGPGGALAPKALEGRLVVCDLAGSERIKKTHAKGGQLAEAASINGSLLVLGRVVEALTDRRSSQHVPFRESKLTRLLQYSLSGYGKTSLIVNVSPSDDNTEETLSTISFGQRAIQIKQNAEKHEVIDYKAMYHQLLAEIDSKRDTAAAKAMSDQNEEHLTRIAELEERVRMLEDENAVLQQRFARGAGGAGGGSGADGSPATPVFADPNGGPASPMMVSGEFDAPMFNGRSLRQILLASQAAVKRRDEQLSTSRADNTRLKEELDQQLNKTFAVAARLRATEFNAVTREEEIQAVVDDLQQRLAHAEGKDYVPAEGPRQSDTADRAAELQRLMTDPNAADAEAAAMNKRLIQAVSLLKQQLVEQELQNERARAAIVMLAGDLRGYKGTPSASGSPTGLSGASPRP